MAATRRTTTTKTKTCGAVRDLTDAPYSDANGNIQTTAVCELDKHDDSVEHESYLDGRSHTIDVAHPPTHVWQDKPISADGQPDVCGQCGLFAPDPAKHNEWHRSLGH